jgi:hypothetical protein
MPSRRPATIPAGARTRSIPRPEPIAIVLTPPRHRRHARSAAPALLLLEWLTLTALGAVALALATS